MLAEIKRKMIGEILGADHYISNIHLTIIGVGFMDIAMLLLKDGSNSDKV